MKIAEALDLFKQWPGADVVALTLIVKKYGGRIPARILEAARSGQLKVR